MRKTRYITDAALMSALVCIFLFISRQAMNFLDDFALILLPLPISLFVLIHGIKKGLLPLITVPLLSFLATDPIRVLCFVIPSICAGYIYGVTYLKGYDKNGGLSIKIICTLLINLLTTVLMAKILFGMTVVEEMSAMSKEIIKFLGNFSISPLALSLIEAMCFALIPSIIIVTSMLEGYLVHVLFSFLRYRLLRQGKVQTLSFKVKLPKIVTSLALVIIILSFATLSLYFDEEGIVKIIHIIGINVAMVSIIVLIMEGLMLALAYAKYHRKTSPYFFTVIMLFIFPIFPMILGIIDSFGGYQEKINLLIHGK